MSRCNDSFFISLWNAVTSLCSLPSMATGKSHLCGVKVHSMASCSLFFGSVSSIIQWWAIRLREINAAHFVCAFASVWLCISSHSDRTWYWVCEKQHDQGFLQTQSALKWSGFQAVWVCMTQLIQFIPETFIHWFWFWVISIILTHVVKQQINIAFSKVF